MMQKLFQILNIDTKHILTLVELSRTTFTETFADANTPENMAAYLDECMTPTALEQELKDVDNKFYFICHEQRPVGYLKLRITQPNAHFNEMQLEIERIYVLREFQGKKFGVALMQFAFEFAKQHCIKRVWLGVWEHNHKAIQFYRGFGFEIFGSHIFTLGADPQTDLLMHRDL
jgi:diamine N-acetyltransferase